MWQTCEARVAYTNSKYTNWVADSFLYPAADEPHFALNMPGVFLILPKESDKSYNH